jgi:hypothetical protein
MELNVDGKCGQTNRLTFHLFAVSVETDGQQCNEQILQIPTYPQRCQRWNAKHSCDRKVRKSQWLLSEQISHTLSYLKYSKDFQNNHVTATGTLWPRYPSIVTISVLIFNHSCCLKIHKGRYKIGEKTEHNSSHFVGLELIFPAVVYAGQNNRIKRPWRSVALITPHLTNRKSWPTSPQETTARSVNIVRLQTKSHGICFYCLFMVEYECETLFLTLGGESVWEHGTEGYMLSEENSYDGSLKKPV